MGNQCSGMLMICQPWSCLPCAWPLIYGAREHYIAVWSLACINSMFRGMNKWTTGFVNSLAPGSCGCNFKLVIFKFIPRMSSWNPCWVQDGQRTTAPSTHRDKKSEYSLSVTISNSDLLHGTLHHATKFQAITWFPHISWYDASSWSKPIMENFKVPWMC